MVYKKKQEVENLLSKRLSVKDGPDSDVISNQALKVNKNLIFKVAVEDGARVEIMVELETYRRYDAIDGSVEISGFLVEIGGKKADRRKVKIDYCPVDKKGVIFV